MHFMLFSPFFLIDLGYYDYLEDGDIDEILHISESNLETTISSHIRKIFPETWLWNESLSDRLI